MVLNHFSENSQIDIVSNFTELIKKEFIGEMNAVCWQRTLRGDFEEIVSGLKLEEDITEIGAKDLLSLRLSDNGIIARDIILSDIKLLADVGASPTLNLLKRYDRDNALEFISTDVYSFHVDRAPIPTSTFLCTYFGTATDILPNAQATQKIQIPEVREKLRALYSGSEKDFEMFLKDYCFDLHYEAKPQAKPINLGQGHLWKLAVDSPESHVLPCIHRAPLENDAEYRLLLIC